VVRYTLKKVIPKKTSQTGLKQNGLVKVTEVILERKVKTPFF
jgi:hypothetical protein